MEDLRALLRETRERLASVPRTRLGAVRDPGRIRRLFGGRPVIVPADEVWHLGVLLVGDSDVWTTGTVLRAEREVIRGYSAESQRERAVIRGMAFRGGFATGETFHVDWSPVDVERITSGGSSGPVTWDGERLMVRWSPAGFLTPLADYLDERIRLAQS